MADNNEVKFKLDLDISQFSDNALEALGTIKSLGEPDNVEGLLKVLGEVGISLGVVATAALAFKAAIDLSEEAEDITRVREEFDNLSASAGISARELQEGLEKSAGGLIDTNALLKDANEAIVKMGASAAQLPAIMDVARQATAVFGGDLNTNFNNIANAIGNGNTRMLKQYGIVVDTAKAYRDFANANNVAIDSLSEAGKRQAVMNAALEQAQDRFKGISGTMGQTATSMQLFKTTLTEIKDTFILVFEKTLGPGLHTFLNTVNEVAGKVKTAMTSMFGQGLDQNAAQIQQATNRLDGLKAKLVELQAVKGNQGFFDKLVHGDNATQIQKVNQEIAETTAMLNVLHQVNTKLVTDDKTAEVQKQKLMNTGKTATQNAITDQQKIASNDAKFRTEMAAASKAYYKAEEQNIQSLPQLELIINQQRIAIAQQHAAKLLEIQKNESLNRTQKMQLASVENKTYMENVIGQERAMAAVRTQLLNQYVANSQNAFQGIERAAQQMTSQAQAELANFGMQGQEVMNSFKQNSVSAFQTMGASISQGVDVAQAATQAITQLFLGMIGDIAIQDGTRMLLSGIWPPNPVALAGGAALIAFGGALKSLAGSSSTTTSTGAVATSTSTTTATNGGVGTTTQNDPSPVPGAAMAPAQTQRTVNFNIAGSLFNTSTTQRQLMEMMRQETNATGFTYNTIGV